MATLRSDLRDEGLLIPTNKGYLDLRGVDVKVLFVLDEDNEEREDGFNCQIQHGDDIYWCYSIDLDF